MLSTLILARNASAWTGPTGNNTFLFNGAIPTLIDAGVGDPAHIDDIASALQGAPLAAVLITHTHSDHTSGIPALVARWPAVDVRREFHDGEIVAVGDDRLRAIHTPGHAPDHFCFLDESAGDLYCGDLLRANGTIVIPPSHGGNLRHYLESLHRARDLSPRRLLPAHGPIITNPPEVIDSYLTHRAYRERQIVAALARRGATPSELVPEVYGTLPAGLQDAAAESILAHLIKLEEEGRAASEADGRWRPLPP